MALKIADLPLGGGWLALTPMPGRDGGYADDLAALVAWRPDCVVTLATRDELDRRAPDLPRDLAAAGILWHPFPITDYGTPSQSWLPLSADLQDLLARGGRVLLHCLGGCGRSGMIALALMVAAGEPLDDALARLRRTRPCAVETAAQLEWARAQGRSG